MGDARNIDTLVKTFDCCEDAASLREPPQGFDAITHHIRVVWDGSEPASVKRHCHGPKLVSIIAVDEPTLAGLVVLLQHFHGKPNLRLPCFIIRAR